jgi:hypothetical protein
MEQYTSKAGTEIHAVFDTVKFGDLHMVKYAMQRDVANIHVMGRVDSVGTGKGKRQTTGACVFTVFEKDRLLAAVAGTKKVFLTDHELINYGSGNNKDDFTINGKKITQAQNYIASGSRRFNTINPETDADLGTGNTLVNIFAAESYGANAAPVLADQIPPFDITLVGVSEVDSTTANRMVIHGVQFTSDQGGTSIDDLVLERQLTFIARRVSPWKLLTELT